MSPSEPNGPDRTTVRVGATEVELTIGDAEAIRDALIEYLRRSDYYARDRLISWTGGAVLIDSQGKVRLGPWMLGSDANDLVLRFQEPPGPEQGKAHRASLAKQGDRWTITGLVMQRIRPARKR